MKNSGRPELEDMAYQLEDAKKDFWRAKKQQELDGADEVMVRRYATAVALARKYNVRSTYVSRAIARLAYFTDIIGDAKMAGYVQNAPDPTNKGATKLPYKQGQYVQPGRGRSWMPAARRRFRTVFGLTSIASAIAATLSPRR